MNFVNQENNSVVYFSNYFIAQLYPFILFFMGSLLKHTHTTRTHCFALPKFN